MRKADRRTMTKFIENVGALSVENVTAHPRKSLAKPPVAILAGGLGTRLSEETAQRPKPLVEVGGKPVIWHVMKHYEAHGMTEFAVALGYKKEAVIRYFLDLPIYRLGDGRYYQERDAHVDRTLFPPGSPYSEQRRADEKKKPSSLAGIRDHFEKSYGGCWRYNEIVGYIRLHFLGSQVRGEYYGVNRRRIVRTRTKQLEYRTWKLAPEVDIPRDATDSDIFSAVIRYVDDGRTEVKGRFIDDSQLIMLGPYINWRELYENNLSRKQMPPSMK